MNARMNGDRARRRPSERALARRRRLAGVAYLLAPALLIWLSLAVYNKDFTDSDTITLETGPVGNEMHPHADVKLRGVVVGEVRDIDTDGSGSTLTLAIQPGRLEHVPANVTAQLLPTTLFGQRYVALVPPAEPAAQPLAAESVIPQDRSANAIELEQTLDNLMPLLTAVQPSKLALTLDAVSDALQGRGEKIGNSMVTLDGYLEEFNPNLPSLNRNIKEFVEVSEAYAKAAPDVVDALHDATTTSATLAEQRAGLSTLYANVTAASQDLDTWLVHNRKNLIRLAGTSRPTLEVLAEHSPAFPCTLDTLADFVPKMDAALGRGTSKPGLRVDVDAVEPRGAYEPGRDAPRYAADGDPRCYPVPYTGGSTAPVSAGSGAASTFSSAANGLGVVNSPQENALVNELLAAETTADPDELPQWSSVLAGPAFRGAEVSLR